VVVSSPVLVVAGAVVGVAALGTYAYGEECKYDPSLIGITGVCTVFG